MTAGAVAEHRSFRVRARDRGDRHRYLPLPPPELLAAHDIREVSLYIHWGRRRSVRARSPTTTQYYERLGDDADLPTTSQPSIGDFLEVYEPLLDAGKRSSRSTSPAACRGPSGPPSRRASSSATRADRVHVIDSATACGGEGLVVLAAAAAARDGADGAGRRRPTRARPARELKMWFAIDTLEYLRRGGRIAGAQAWLGSALKIKPILTVESEITPVERVRTSKRAFERMVDLLRPRKEDGADAWMVQHIQAPRAGGGAGGARNRDIRVRAAGDLRDRPGDRDPRRPGPARRRRPPELAVVAPLPAARNSIANLQTARFVPRPSSDHFRAGAARRRAATPFCESMSLFTVLLIGLAAWISILVVVLAMPQSCGTRRPARATVSTRAPSAPPQRTPRPRAQSCISNH